MEKFVLLLLFIVLGLFAVSAGPAVQVSVGRSDCFGIFRFLSCSSVVRTGYSFANIGFSSLFIKCSAGCLYETANITSFATLSGSKFFSFGLGSFFSIRKLLLCIDVGLRCFDIAGDSKNRYAACYMGITPTFKVLDISGFSVFLITPNCFYKSGSIDFAESGFGFTCKFTGS